MFHNGFFYCVFLKKPFNRISITIKARDQKQIDRLNQTSLIRGVGGGLKICWAVSFTIFFGLFGPPIGQNRSHFGFV